MRKCLKAQISVGRTHTVVVLELYHRTVLTDPNDLGCCVTPIVLLVCTELLWIAIRHVLMVGAMVVSSVTVQIKNMVEALATVGVVC